MPSELFCNVIVHYEEKAHRILFLSYKLMH